MSRATRSFRAARDYRKTLFWSKLLLGLGIVTAGFTINIYSDPGPILFVIGLLSAWVAICHNVESFTYRKVLSFSLDGPAFILIALITPARITILEGLLIGTTIYLLIILYAILKPSMSLVSGDRFYNFRYPLQRLIPLAYLAGEPLNGTFEPVISFHWEPGIFNIPNWCLSVTDPAAFHNYIRSRVTILGRNTRSYHDGITIFRSAVGILNMLESVRRYEEIDLDGVALAASARLALASAPWNSRNVLVEVLHTMNPEVRARIMGAYDIRPTYA